MVQQYTTIIVLVSGVFGGLGVVILLILFCKHCINKPSKETGLEVDDVEADHNAAKVALLDKTSAENKQSVSTSQDQPHERRLLRQSDVRLDTIECGGTSLDLQDEYVHEDQGNNNGWRGVITVDDADIYDRLYPENQLKPDTNQWLGERDVSMPRSRQSSRLALNMGGSTGSSRRTLQSSLDSSVCTDNRSEITVIEVPPGERYPIDLSKRSASQDEPRGTPTAAPRMYLSAFRPIVQKRRQSSHTETGRTHEKLERRIKSHDDAVSYRPQDQEMAIAECIPRRNSAQYDTQRNSPSHSPRIERPRASFDRIQTQSHMETGVSRYNRRNSDISDVNLTPSSKSYKELWKLRSTLEESDKNETEVSIDEDQTMSDTTSNNETVTQERSKILDHKKVVCSVVYTSVESENFDRFEDSISNQTEEETGGGDNLLHPPEQMFVSRRQHFQRFMISRGRRGYMEGYSSTEKSFDSFDTTTTDGARSSDSSRVEVTTTSFESSTTNELTDSSESSAKRLQMRQNKDDSGYKSIENQQQTSLTRGASQGKEQTSPEEEQSSAIVSTHYSRTVSKRRRDFQNRHFVPPNLITSCSSFELETTDSNPYMSDSFDEPGSANVTNRYSVFFRMFHTNSRYGKRRQHIPRDYSVDEKTDALFREFTRYDPQFERRRPQQYSRSCSNPSISYFDNSRDEWISDQNMPVPSDWNERHGMSHDPRPYDRRSHNGRMTNRMPLLQASVS